MSEFTGKGLDSLPWERKIQLSARDVKCGRCGEEYNTIKNFGKWHCYQHARAPVVHGSETTWPCCGGKVGCVAADHSQIADFRYKCIHHESLPLSAAVLLKPQENAVCNPHTKGLITNVTILRYDEKAAKKLGEGQI